MADKKTLEEIDTKLEQLREEKRLRLIQEKKREIRKRYISENSCRGIENQIKYMLGGMILSIWGKSKALQTLEKTDMENSQKKTVEAYTLHYQDAINEEISKIENTEEKENRSKAIQGILDNLCGKEADEARQANLLQG